MLSRNGHPGTDRTLAAWFESAAPNWDDAVLPAYLGGSIANLPASVLAGMNADAALREGLLPPVAPDILPGNLFDDARVVMLIVIDGLGALALNEHASLGDVPGLASAPLRSTLTSVFPPTTAAATTSLQYGVGPGTHGMAGYTIYLPEIGDVFNMITWRNAANGDEPEAHPAPETFLAGPHIYSLLERSGVDTVIVSNRAFETSPLTRAQASGVRYRGYRTLADFCYRLVREVERPGRRFVFGYWDGYDALGHTWGTDTDIARLEIRLIDQAFREGLLGPLEALKEEVTLLVTADHGHIRMPRDERIDLAQLPGLMDALRHRPTGEPRQIGLTFREDAGVAASALEERWGDQLVAVDLQDAIVAGLYGPPPLHAEISARTGEMLLLARGPGAINFPGGSSGSVGGHGSLTAREMQVPLLVWRTP